MSVSSPVQNDSRHLHSSEEDEVNGVVSPKCRLDSGEDGSVASANRSPKVSCSAPVSFVEVCEHRTGCGGLLTKKPMANSVPVRSTSAKRPPLGSVSSRSRRSSDRGSSNRESSRSSAASVSPGMCPQETPARRVGPASRPGHLLEQREEDRTPVPTPARESSDRLALTPLPHAEPLPSPAHLQSREEAQAEAQRETAPFADDEAPTCCICMEVYSTDNPMFHGGCTHHFHLPCLLGWKQRSNTCPMCCAETLRGIGELDEPVPSPPSPQLGMESPLDISADELLALELQRKYLRRAKRRAEERQRMSLSGDRFTAPSSSSARPSPQLSGNPTAATAPPAMSLPASAPNNFSLESANPVPITATAGVPSQPMPSRSSRRRNSNRPPKGKADCTVM